MTLNINDGGTWKTAIPHVNDGGTWKPVTAIWVNDAGTWRQAYASTGISVTVSPTSISNTGIAGGRTFAACTVTVTGGTPTSYTWSFIGQTGGTYTVSSGQGTATANATVTGVAIDTTTTATFRCSVVVGGQTYTVDVPLQYSRVSV